MPITLFALTIPYIFKFHKFSPEKRGSAMGLYGLVICFAPAIGPTLAGIIIDRWSWYYLFYMLIPIIVLDIIFLTFFMKDVIPLKSPNCNFFSFIFLLK